QTCALPIWGEDGEMCSLVGLGTDRPDISAVSCHRIADGLHCSVGLTRNAVTPSLACERGLREPLNCRGCYGFGNGLGIEVVSGRLGEQEDVLVALGASIPHALWHRVGL